MPVTLPTLDDRSYTDLVAEARALIPTVAPEWTNHNPTDPGMMLLELFAYLSELLIYRLDQVPAAHLIAFLNLLHDELRAGPELKPPLDGTIGDTVTRLRQCDRAVTCADFEALALVPDAKLNPQRVIARAHCLPNCDLESAHVAMTRPGHVSVIIVPRDQAHRPEPTPAQLALVKAYLEPRRLLATWVHVVKPSYVEVKIQMRLYLLPDAVEARVRAGAEQCLRQFFDPITGGPDGQGWPFGRAIYVSEIYQLLDTLPGIDYVEKDRNSVSGEEIAEVSVVPPAHNRATVTTYEQAGKPVNALVAVALQPHELVALQKIVFTIISPVTDVTWTSL